VVDAPIELPAYGGECVRDVRMLHTFAHSDTDVNLSQVLGKHVRLSVDTFLDAHTGHHHTRFLVVVARMEESRVARSFSLKEVWPRVQHDFLGIPTGNRTGCAVSALPQVLDLYIVIYMNILIEIDAETYRRLEKVAPAKSRKRSAFIRAAIQKSLWELEEERSRRAYLAMPDGEAAPLDPGTWDPTPYGGFDPPGVESARETVPVRAARKRSMQRERRGAAQKGVTTKARTRASGK